MKRLLILSATAVPLLVDASLKGAALLALAGLGVLMMPRSSAAARHLVWLVAVLALLAVPVLSLVLPGWRVLPAWAVPPSVAAAPALEKDRSSTSHESHRTYAPIPAPAVPRELPSLAANPEFFPRSPAPAAPAAALAPAAASAALPPTVPWWRKALPFLWSAGGAALLLRLIGAHWLLRRAARRARPVTDGPLAAALAAAASQLGVTQRVRLLVEEKRTIPVVWGVWRPRLLLPAEALTWDAGQLQSVLLHELAHIRRRDTLVQWVTQIACALHWFNPLVWLAAWRLHVERERACDDMVLASGVKPSAYAGHLLHVASQLSPARWTSACGLAMARKSALEGRLMAVLSGSRNRRRVTRLFMVSAAVLGGVVAIPVAILQAQSNAAREISTTPVPMPDRTGKLQPETLAKLKWGDPVNGLRMALAFPLALKDPLLGDEAFFQLVVQNASGQEVRFTTGDEAPNPRSMHWREGERMVQSLSDRDPQKAEWKLAPGECGVLWMFTKEERKKDGSTISADLDKDLAGGPRYHVICLMEVATAPAGAWTGKLTTGPTRGSGDVAATPAPQQKDARALYEIWQRHARTNGDLPGALIGELAAAVKTFIGYNPTWESVPKLNAILPRLDATHDWKPADAIPLLDEMAAVQDSPLQTAAEKLTGATIRTGEPLPEKFAGVAWGETQSNGLRAAWVLEPGGSEHRLGEALKARLLVQNNGKLSIMTRVPTWHQGSVAARDAADAALEVSGIDWTTLARLVSVRLGPGEFIEINAPGVGLGPQAGMGPWAGPRVGSNVLAQPGQELTLTHSPLPLDGIGVGMREDAPHMIGPGWWQAHLKAYLSRELPLPAGAAERTHLLDRAMRELFATAPTAEETAAFTADQTPGAFDALGQRLATRADVVEFAGPLPTAPVKFRVLAADPAADKSPRVVLGPGEYPVGGDTPGRGRATLKITGRPVGDRRTNDAQLLFGATEATGKLPPDPYQLRIPDGWGTWAIVCRPGDPFFYLLHQGGVRKIDYSDPAIVTDLPASDLPDAFRDEVKRQLGIAGVSDAQQAGVFEKPAPGADGKASAGGTEAKPPEPTHLWNDKYSAVAYQTEKAVNFVLVYEGFISSGMSGSFSTAGKWSVEGNIHLVDKNKTEAAGRNVDKRVIAVKHTSDEPETLYLDGKAYALGSGRAFVLGDAGGPFQLACPMALRNMDDLVKTGDFATNEMKRVRPAAKAALPIRARNAWSGEWQAFSKVVAESHGLADWKPDDVIAWGPEEDGLRSGMLIPKCTKLGDTVIPLLVLRNISNATKAMNVCTSLNVLEPTVHSADGKTFLETRKVHLTGADALFPVTLKAGEHIEFAGPPVLFGAGRGADGKLLMPDWPVAGVVMGAETVRVKFHLGNVRGPETGEVTMEVKAPGPVIHGKVLKPDGSPAVGVQMRVDDGWERWKFRGPGIPDLPGPVTTAADGTFSIEVPKDSAAENYEVFASSDDFAPLNAKVPAGGDVGMMQFAKGSLVTGRVIGPDGAGLAKVGIWCRQLDWHGRGPAPTKLTDTGTDGTFSLPPIATGRHLLQILTRDLGAKELAVAFANRVIEAKDNAPLEVEIRPLPTVDLTLHAHVIRANAAFRDFEVRVSGTLPGAKAGDPEAYWTRQETTKLEEGQYTIAVPASLQNTNVRADRIYMRKGDDPVFTWQLGGDAPPAATSTLELGLMDKPQTISVTVRDAPQAETLEQPAPPAAANPEAQGTATTPEPRTTEAPAKTEGNLIKILDDQYTKSGLPVDDVKDVVWNDSQNGLSLGYRIIGDEWRILGKPVEVELWVRNAGDKDVKFQVSRRPDIGLQLKLKHGQGVEQVSGIMASTAPALGEPCLLPPGHALKVKAFPISLLSPANDVSGTGGHFFSITPGAYELQCGLELPGFNATGEGGKQLTPAAGEWTGQLTTRGLNISVVAPDAPALKTATAGPRPDETPPRPKHEYAQSLFRKWQASARTDGKIPGALIGHLAKQVDSYLQQYPKDENSTKLAAVRPKLEASDDWTQAAAVALLDEITAVTTASVSWADLPMEFDGSHAVQGGQPLPVELDNAPWGQPAGNGLRAAWLLEPRAEHYAPGSVLKARVLFHNTGKAPVVFQTETWHQQDGHKALDGNGAEIPVKATWFTGITPIATFRLAPGEFCEVSGHGIAIGAGEYQDELSTAAIGAIIEAKEGDMVTLTHTVDAAPGGWTKPNDPKDPAELRKQIIARRVESEAPMPRAAADREQLIRRVTLDLSGTQPTPMEVAAFNSDDTPDALAKLTARLQAKPADVPWTGKLPTGETKFRVIAADPDAAKAPRTAVAPGRYVLGDNVHLQATQITTADGKRTNKAQILFLSPDPKVASLHEPYNILLPGGSGTYAFAWVRGSGELWLLRKAENILWRYRFAADGLKEEGRYDLWPPTVLDKPLRRALQDALGLRAATDIPPLGDEALEQPEPGPGPKQTATLKPGTEERLSWGEPVNGLRAALVRVPPEPAMAPGVVVDLNVVVQNVSDAPVKLRGGSPLANVNLKAVQADGTESALEPSLLDVLSSIDDFTLQPREVAVMSLMSVGIGKQEANAKSALGRSIGYWLPAGNAPGGFTAGITFANPLPGYWSGTLNAPFEIAHGTPGGTTPAPETDSPKPAGASAPKLPKLPEDAYATPGVPVQKFREEDARRPGGKLMGEVLESTKPGESDKEPLVLGVRTASDAAWRIGGSVKVGLVVRNRSESDVKFSYTGRLDNGLSIVAVDEAGQEHTAVIAFFDSYLILQHMLLPVAHTAALKEFTLHFGAEKPDTSESHAAAFHLPPGKYTLRCKWNDARPDVAHEGEWTGELVNEELAFTLADDAAPSGGTPKTSDTRERRKLDWSKFPTYDKLANPFDPEEALRVAAAVAKGSRQDIRRLMYLILQASAEKDPELQPLLKDDRLKNNDDNFHSIGLALGAYDYAVNGNRMGLQFILDELAKGPPGGDVQAAGPLGFIDEWDVSLAAHEKHFARTDGAGAESAVLFWERRQFLFPEKLAKFKKKRLAAAELDADSLRGVWSGSKNGVAVELRLGENQGWEVRHGNGQIRSALTTDAWTTGKAVTLMAPRAKGGAVPCGELSRGGDGTLLLSVWPDTSESTAYPRVSGILLTRSTGEPPKAGAKLGDVALEGAWEGEKDGAAVTVEFQWLSRHQQVRWEVKRPSSSIAAQMSVVMEPDGSAAKLIFRQGLEFEATQGRVTRGDNGTLNLEIIPNPKVSDPGYPLVQGLVLKRIPR